jgi:nucleoid-associated protein YgaU
MQGNPSSDAGSAGAVSLRVLIPFLLLFGAGLYEVVGLPHAPSPPIDAPDLSSLEAILRSSRPPLDGAMYVIGMLGWLVWAWPVLSLLLEVGVALAEQVADGTAVVRRARGIADVLSAPLVRKAVRASLAGGLVARMAFAGVPAAAAAPTETAAIIVDFSPRGGPSTLTEPQFWATFEEPAIDVPYHGIAYTVQPGDNLVRIAECFYGDGDKWQLLYESNQGRRMSDGLTFDRAGVIHPGWQLIVPDPTSTIETDADGQRWYTVRKGDSLAGISARLLGDERRWPELYSANVGVRLDDRHVLQDPRLIWPGLELRVPALDLEPEPPGDTSSPLPAAAPLTATPVPESPPTASQDVSTVTPAAADGGDPTPHADYGSRLPVDTATMTPSVEAPLPAEESGSQRPIPPAVGATAGAAAALAAVGGAALIVRRRHPRPARGQPESDVLVNAGFAEAEPTGEFGPNLDGDDLATASLIAARLSRALATELLHDGGDNSALPTDGTTLAAVRHGRSSTTLLLHEVPMGARAQLIGALPDAASRAFGARSDVEGMVSRDGDVLIRVSSVPKEALAGGGLDLPDGPDVWAAPSMLIRMGLLTDRQVLAANWDALSHVLVASPSGLGAEAVLEALVASLLARRSPAELGLIVLGRPHSVSDDLLHVFCTSCTFWSNRLTRTMNRPRNGSFDYCKMSLKDAWQQGRPVARTSSWLCLSWVI